MARAADAHDAGVVGWSEAPVARAADAHDAEVVSGLEASVAMAGWAGGFCGKGS